MVSRFTLDSATEYLFGHDVRTLSAGLPYPASSPLARSSEFMNHPSNKFANAFTAGQYHTALRVWQGADWPLAEFLADKVKPFRKIVDEFIEPILKDALAEHAVTENKLSEGEKANDDGESLLTHLLSHMQGFRVICSSSRFTTHATLPDKQMLKDEVGECQSMV
jgi:hypothetical protein